MAFANHDVRIRSSACASNHPSAPSPHDVHQIEATAEPEVAGSDRARARGGATGTRDAETAPRVRVCVCVCACVKLIIETYIMDRAEKTYIMDRADHGSSGSAVTFDHLKQLSRVYSCIPDCYR